MDMYQKRKLEQKRKIINKIMKLKKSVSTDMWGVMKKHY